ncbi:DUF2218 domain-containing protein [Enterovirga rhinocerotis]|uniref:DUF2218 domain-containing protein n=1 Tax=Enterovirga rhinocerotis TaxID=1339210 RepID=A0A4R7CB86_9HYPH|nr:DUF2218 domain-containing protein [Enterovirga rhinocerotis]TDR95686.1 hypothetical protein EV668_0028 [Enterovirga rhinocerotis]
MLRSQAVIKTLNGSRYLQQLSKHWAHRFDTEFNETSARIALPLGETRLSADDVSLKIDLSAETASALSDLRDVVVRHVERFAFRETLAFEWSQEND